MRFFSIFNRSARPRTEEVNSSSVDKDAVVSAVSELSLEAAEREAGTVLKDTTRFRTEASRLPNKQEAAYGPILQQFFRCYSRVCSTRSEVELEGGEEVRSEADRSLSVIGYYGEHVEIDVVAGGDEIVVLSTEAEPEVFWRFPTIYHFVCFLGRTEAS